MNAAARLVHRRTLSRHLTFAFLTGKRQWMMVALIFAILISALGVIYVTQVNRVMYANYQRELSEQEHLQTQTGQLLLERSAWMMQARIQQVAEQKLGMVVPDHKSVVIIHE